MPFSALSICVIIKKGFFVGAALRQNFPEVPAGLPACERRNRNEGIHTCLFQPAGRRRDQRPRGCQPVGGTAHRALRPCRPSARRGRSCRRAGRQPYRDPRCSERNGAGGLCRAGARHWHRGQPLCAEPAQPAGSEAGILSADPQLWQLPPRRRHSGLSHPCRRRDGPQPADQPRR